MTAAVHLGLLATIGRDLGTARGRHNGAKEFNGICQICALTVTLPNAYVHSCSLIGLTVFLAQCQRYEVLHRTIKQSCP